jgi:Resolvase, N terminal domain
MINLWKEVRDIQKTYLPKKPLAECVEKMKKLDGRYRHVLARTQHEMEQGGMSYGNQVIALLRVSTDTQDLARQRADLKRVIASHDLQLIRTEEVGGVSGRHVQQDPQFQGIFRDLERADVAGVAISALDRLFRLDFYGEFGILDHFRLNKKLFAGKT